MSGQTVRLGRNGPDVGKLAFGCWRFVGHELSHAETLIDTALDHGMSLIDTADVYGAGTPSDFGGAEALLGKVLAAEPARRDRMVIATKGGIDLPVPYNSSHEWLMRACEASLVRLGIECIDLYQIHRPDLLTPWEEVAEVLDALISSGKISHAGISNFTAAQARALQAHFPHRLVSLQPEFSALEVSPIETGELDWCQETDAACLAWSPLARGRLGDGYVPVAGDPECLSDVLAVLDRLAGAHGATRSQIALAFVLHHPANMVAIVGTQTPSRLAEAAKALSVQLSRRDWYDILEASYGQAMP